MDHKILRENRVLGGGHTKTYCFLQRGENLPTNFANIPCGNR